MSGHDRLAVAVQRLAVLASAGIPAASAWRHLAAATDHEGVRQVAAGLESAHDLPDRLAAAARAASPTEAPAWRVLAATWTVAADAGSPLAPTLERLAQVLRELGRHAREVEVAVAGPRATGRVVLALPVLGLLLGAVLGFDLAAAFGSVPGAVCLVVGSTLLVVAERWNRRLLRWARDVDAGPGIGCELHAVALAGGMSIERAGALVARACATVGLDAADDPAQVLRFAREAGVPVVALLRAEADATRRDARTEAATRAARLETRMLLPLGLCVLPAFVLLGVVPIALAIFSSTAAVL